MHAYAAVTRAALGIAASFSIAIAGCSERSSRSPPARPATAKPSAASPNQAPKPLRLAVLGTNDLHGHIEALPILGGYVAAVRAALGPEHVLLVDAGDMFQGTLASNLFEGQSVVLAYAKLGYDAVALGNHEFDFGPAGPAPTPTSPADDPRGALKARMAEAPFPFLSANVLDAARHASPDWPNFRASILVTKDGVKIGIVGATTEDTPRTTIATNFAGLEAAPIAPIVAREAAALRRSGAALVVLVVHEGGRCDDLSHPDRADACDPSAQIVRVIQRLPKRAVDVVVAGHTHQGMANFVDGVPIIESYSYGRAFGRVDVDVDAARGVVLAVHIHPPEELKASGARYEGRAVEPAATVAAAVAPFMERAREKKERRVGVRLEAPVRRGYDVESAEGNLFADLVRASRPRADVGLVNGGGLRDDLPAGELTYGALFDAMPFDNRVATVKLTGKELTTIVTSNLVASKGIISLSGVRVVVACRAGDVDVRLLHDDGRRVRDDESLVVATSDFLATGGDGLGLPADRAHIEDTLVRDALEAGLKGRGVVRPNDVYDPAHPRIRLPSARPVRCGQQPR